MTDNQINAAIAAHLGITPKICITATVGAPHCTVTGFAQKSSIPDFAGDLNAMHNAEKVLSGKSYWQSYSNMLVVKMGCEDIFHATARQRAEAFLRTIGKWEEVAK